LDPYQAALARLGASLEGLRNLYAQRAPLESERAALGSQREQILQGLIRRKPTDAPRSPEKEAEIGKLDIAREVLAGQAEFLEREIIDAEDALQRELSAVHSDLTRLWQELKAWTWGEALARIAGVVDPDLRALQKSAIEQVVIISSAYRAVIRSEPQLSVGAESPLHDTPARPWSVDRPQTVAAIINSTLDLIKGAQPLFDLIVESTRVGFVASAPCPPPGQPSPAPVVEAQGQSESASTGVVIHSA
jgi:hypothetical protein